MSSRIDKMKTIEKISYEADLSILNQTESNWNPIKSPTKEREREKKETFLHEICHLFK